MDICFSNFSKICCEFKDSPDDLTFVEHGGTVIITLYGALSEFDLRKQSVEINQYYRY